MRLVHGLCTAAALLTSTSAFAQSGSWTISEASGRVILREGQAERSLSRGATVPAGGTVVTGPSSRAVMVRGEDFVTMSANTRIRVPEAAQATGLFQLIEEWGSAVFKVKHSPKPRFGVQTPYLAAVVKGTTFSINVSNEGASLQVVEGAVGVATSDGGANELIRPGMVAVVAASDQFRLNVQGQSARTIDSPQRGATSTATDTGGSSSVDTESAGEQSATSSPLGEGLERSNSDSLGTSMDSAGPPVFSSEVFVSDGGADQAIGAAIEAEPVDIAAATRGLIGAGPQAAPPQTVAASIASVATVAREIETPNSPNPGPGNGNGNPNPGPGNGNGNPNPGPGNGNGNPNPGPGNGNGNPNPGPGNGNGNPNPGPGNGNGNPNPGPGNGNGNPNPGPGNGNGNPNPGPGNGNGNPNPGPGNGNGNPSPGPENGNGNPSPGDGNPGGNGKGPK
ncbi:FecR domain-containing protein [Novosphingobium sp. M1R2S20]|uniref:FecR domain-containing protein n=1 Tax=Novosphingobium rhizovicinum TaxID=3228928 RepID=A0ABV3RFS8_9SPHN